MPHGSLSLLLYLVSALDRLLLANAMTCNTVMSCALSLSVHSFLTYGSPALRPTPDLSFSKYIGLAFIVEHHACVFLYYSFALFYSSSCFWFIIHPVFTE